MDSNLKTSNEPNNDSVELKFEEWAKGYTPPKSTKTKSYPEIMDKLANFLEQNGHSCPVIIGTENHEFRWCGKDICSERTMQIDMQERDREMELFAEELRTKGHVCISKKETYPVQIDWCGSEKCKNFFY